MHARTLRNILSAMVAAVILPAATLSLAWAQDKTPQSLKLTILHMNDAHGHYESYPEDGVAGLVGGFAKAKTVIDRIRAENGSSGRETLVLMAGDLLMGTVFTETFKGELGAKLLNAMGFTAMTVGNHEFDYGLAPLYKNLKLGLNCPLLSANIRDEYFRPQFDVVRESSIGDTRVVLFGLTTTSTRARGLFVSDPLCAAKEVLDRYSEQDLIIAITHVGLPLDRKLRNSCPTIDVIVGGHSHDKLTPSFQSEPRPIVQAGAYSRYVGRLDLEVRDGKVIGYESTLIDLGPDITDNEEISLVISEYKKNIPSCWSSIAGKSELFLKGTFQEGWSVYRTAPLAKLITYVMAKHSGSEVAITNAGGIRWSIPKGNVTYGDLFQVLPFPNRCVKMDLKGHELQNLLRDGVEGAPGYRELLQTFGLALEEDALGNLVIRKVRDADFDPEKSYSVVTNDYLAARMYRRGLLGKRRPPIPQDPTLIRDLVAEFIREQGVITAQLIDELK